MRILVAFAALTAANAYGADFRTLNFSQSCAGVNDLETALGSTPIPPEKSEPFINPPANIHKIAFRGRAFAREATITYVCLDGQLFEGNLRFPTQDRTGATDTYQSTYGQLSAQYGPPQLDNSPMGDHYLELNPPPIPAGIRVHFASTWIDADHIISLALQANGDGPAAAWQVFIAWGPGRAKVRESNNRIERRVNHKVPSSGVSARGAHAER